MKKLMCKKMDQLSQQHQRTHRLLLYQNIMISCAHQTKKVSISMIHIHATYQVLDGHALNVTKAIISTKLDVETVMKANQENQSERHRVTPHLLLSLRLRLVNQKSRL